MKKSTVFLLIAPLLLLLPLDGEAQDMWRPYFNVGYVTNIEKCDECEKKDTGGSVRVGVFNRGRFGFYAGYLWFKEHHPAYIGYDDEGSVLLAGIDYRFLRTGGAEWYAKVGIAREKFTSTYPDGRTDDETNFIPDFGLLLNISHFNTYLGWMPSDPHHINIGIGVTR